MCFAYFLRENRLASDEYDSELRVPIVFQSRSFESPLLYISFHFPLSPHLWPCFLNNAYRQLSYCHMVPVCTFIYLLLSLPLCAYTLSIHPPSPAPPRSPLRYTILDSAHVYRTVLLIEDGIDHQIIILQPFLSHSFSACPLRSRRSLGGTAVHMISADLSLFSLLSQTHLGRQSYLAATILSTSRCITTRSQETGYGVI